MLIPLALAGLVAYLGSSLLLGVRLLWLARRSRALADLSFGIAYLAGGALGWATFLVSQTPAVQASPAAPLFARSSLFFVVLGVSAMMLATWRLFRPDRRWAAALAAALAAVMAVEVVHNCLLTATVFPPATDPWYWPGALARSVAFVWLPYEVLRYRAMLQKRRRLGLADARAIDQMLLWGVASLATLASHAVAVVASTLGVERRYGAALILVFSVDGLVSGVAVWLAFFPPAWYVRRVERRGADGG